MCTKTMSKTMLTTMLILLTNIYKKHCKKQCILDNVGNNVLFICEGLKKKLVIRSLFRKCVAHNNLKECVSKTHHINHLQ